MPAAFRCHDGWMSDRWAARPSQPIHPTSTHQRDTLHLSYALTDGYFRGYQNDLTLSVLGKLKDTITGRHKVTVALRGLKLLIMCYCRHSNTLK